MRKRKREKAKQPVNERVSLFPVTKVNEVWRMDSVGCSLSTGRRIRCLTVNDDLSYET